MNARDKLAVTRLRDDIARLKREKFQLLQLIDAAPVGFALLDRNLRFVRINAALKVIDGHLANEHIGQALRDVLPEQASALEPLCREVLQNQTPILNIQISGSFGDNYLPDRQLPRSCLIHVKLLFGPGHIWNCIQ